MFKNIKLYCILLTLSLILTGCGYSMGNLGNPQIQTIAIAPIKNQTYIPNMSESMRKALHERFQVDGSYKVVSMGKADCILYGNIKKVEMTAYDTGYSKEGITYITHEFGLIIQFEFSIVVPGQSKPLIPNTEVAGQSIMQMPTDYYTAQQSAMKQASLQTAIMVVSAATENW
ncbi:MAG: hypothetical protein GY756_10435 [bacterium]|nr:hypothetical protein [bacterium]